MPDSFTYAGEALKNALAHPRRGLAIINMANIGPRLLQYQNSIPQVVPILKFSRMLSALRSPLQCWQSEMANVAAGLLMQTWHMANDMGLSLATQYTSGCWRSAMSQAV